MVDTFQFDAYASPAETTSIQKLNQNDKIGPLGQESKPTLLAMEPGHGSTIDINILDGADLSIPKKRLSPSSSSSSSSKSITESGHGSKTDTDHLMAYPTTNLGEPDLSLPSKKLSPSSSSSSSASESSPQDTFELGANAVTNFSSGTANSLLISKF